MFGSSKKKISQEDRDMEVQYKLSEAAIMIKVQISQLERQIQRMHKEI